MNFYPSSEDLQLILSFLNRTTKRAKRLELMIQSSQQRRWPDYRTIYIITQVILAFWLILAYIWSIRGQIHHYKAFPSAVLKWRKILRIRIIFYATGQKIRYIKVLPRHWTGSRSQKTEDKAVSFRKWNRNNFLAASVGSRARLNYSQTWSW